MKIIAKLIAVNPSIFGKNLLYRNLLLYNIRSVNSSPLCSSKSDEVNQNNEQLEVKNTKHKTQPFLIIPINFFEQLQKLKIDSESITQAIKKLENLNQNSSTDALHLAAIVPTQILSNNAADYIDENKKTFKNIEAPIILKDNNCKNDEPNKNLIDNVQPSNLKDDPIQAYLINKYGDSDHMIPFQVNDDVRQQFNKLPVYELNLEYNIETPELEEFIQKYKNSLKNNSDSRKQLTQNVMPVKFDAEIKGAIKLQPDKLNAILQDMDTTQFNSLLTSLAASICRNVIQKRIEYHNKEIQSELDNECDSDRLSGGVKLNNVQNSSVYIQHTDKLPELDVNNLTPNEVKSNTSTIMSDEKLTDDEINSLNLKIEKVQSKHGLNVLANVGSVSGSPSGTKDNNPCGTKKANPKQSPCGGDGKKDSPCGKKDEKKSNPCQKKDDKKASPCQKKDDKKASPCQKKDDKKASPCQKKDDKKASPCQKQDDKKASPCQKKDDKKASPCQKQDDKKASPCQKKDDKKSSPCGKKDEKKPTQCGKKDNKKPAQCGKKDEKKSSSCGGKKEDKKSKGPCGGGEDKGETSMAACKHEKKVHSFPDKPCAKNTNEKDGSAVPKDCNVKSKTKENQTCGLKIKNFCGAKSEEKKSPCKSSVKHKKSETCHNPCGKK